MLALGLRVLAVETSTSILAREGQHPTEGLDQEALEVQFYQPQEPVERLRLELLAVLEVISHSIPERVERTLQRVTVVPVGQYSCTPGEAVVLLEELRLPALAAR